MNGRFYVNDEHSSNGTFVNGRRITGMTEFENPLLRIVTLALPVIPNVKMSDLGFVDVINKTFISMFDEASC